MLTELPTSCHQAWLHHTVMLVNWVNLKVGDQTRSRYAITIDWLFDGTSTQKRQFVPTAGGGKLDQAAKDDQRDTMHNNLRNTLTV